MEESKKDFIMKTKKLKIERDQTSIEDMKKN